MSDIEPSLDSALESVAEEMITHDPEIRDHIKLLVLKSLRVKLHFLENGTPDTRLRVASSLDTFIKTALAPKRAESDEEANKALEEARRMMMSIIPVDEEIGEDEDEQENREGETGKESPPTKPVP